MRPTYDIQADMARALQGVKEATLKLEGLQREFLEALMAERQAAPLTQAERTLLNKLLLGPIQTDMGEKPDPFTDEESDLLWKLREKGFACYHAESWASGTWTITDEGRKKVQG